MSTRARKSSACVTLVLIGAAALTGCGDSGTSSRRSQYATKEECLADWGEPKDCEKQETRNSSGSGSHFYWGPGARSGSWSSGSSSSSRSSSSSSGSHSTSRGGFGSHGSSAS